MSKFLDAPTLAFEPTHSEHTQAFDGRAVHGEIHHGRMSKSRLEVFGICPFQGWLRYAGGVPEGEVIQNPEGEVILDRVVGIGLHLLAEKLNAIEQAKLRGIVSEDLAQDLPALALEALPFHDPEIHRQVVELAQGLTYWPPDGCQEILPELRMHAKLEATLPLLEGVADRVEVYPDEQRLVVVDYKSSGYAMSRREAADNLQTACLALVAEATLVRSGLEDWTIEVVYMYPRVDRYVSVQVEAQDLEEYRARINARARRVVAMNRFEARPGPACRRCDYTAVCPAFRAELKPDRVLEELHEVNRKIAVLETRKKELGIQALELYEDGAPPEEPGYQPKLQERAQEEFPLPESLAERLAEILPEPLNEPHKVLAAISKIRKSSIEDIAKAIRKTRRKADKELSAQILDIMAEEAEVVGLSRWVEVKQVEIVEVEL